ncbi:hypothetical protein VZ19_004852 [Salmonella enterica subsp. enterica serovar Oranienburg]|nr:hypothetical protein [Salmonella enterica subsp. enterica serovar Oranienburg]EEO7308507.1 hypothetical protein [Salmonella enterica]EEO7818856.1 hypothetical protein [Salmonella enterica]EEO8057599.1 hypothetical protein [Salmonella enterica]EEP0048431.1 hypothetical protein [Salmonella enterica]
MFRRWKGERLPVHDRRWRNGIFLQGIGLLAILAILETLYVMYILWFA